MILVTFKQSKKKTTTETKKKGSHLGFKQGTPPCRVQVPDALVIFSFFVCFCLILCSRVIIIISMKKLIKNSASEFSSYLFNQIICLVTIIR